MIDKQDITNMTPSRYMFYVGLRQDKELFAKVVMSSNRSSVNTNCISIK